MQKSTVVAYFVLLYQGHLFVCVENTHTRCVPLFTSFLTVPLTSGSAFWHIQRLFRIWNFEASRTQIWVRGSLRDSGPQGYYMGYNFFKHVLFIAVCVRWKRQRYVPYLLVSTRTTQEQTRRSTHTHNTNPTKQTMDN